jgi:acetylornithine aminotransferase
VAQVAGRFAAGFDAIAARHPSWLRGPYGLGAMIAATPFEGAAATTRALLHALYERGVIAFSTGGSAARLRFLPPVAVIHDEQIDIALSLLEESLAELAPS